MAQHPSESERYLVARVLVREVVEAKVHRAEAIEIHLLDAVLLDAIVGTLDRSNKWELSISGGALYLDIAGKSFEGALARVLAKA